MYRSKHVEVEIDLDDFTDEDIKEEYEYRNLGSGDNLGDTELKELLEDIYYRKVNGKDFDSLLNEYIYQVIGRIV